jgi:hypothetical protein
MRPTSDVRSPRTEVRGPTRSATPEPPRRRRVPDAKRRAGAASAKAGSRMRLLVTVLWLAISSVASAQWRPDDARPLPPGPEVMAGVRARMAGRALEAEGEARVMDGDGETLGRRRVRLLLDGRGTQPVAVVEINDAFGAPIARARLRTTEEGLLLAEVEQGEPLAPAPDATAASEIPGLGIAWTDLALGFLQWPGAVTEQEEMKLGRLCHVVRLPAPPAAASPYAAVRLWVDAQAQALLQADGLDARGRLVRRLAVRSLRKTDEGDWVVKDFEIADRAQKSRVRLEFESVVEWVDDPDPAAGDTAPDPGTPEGA